MKVSGIEAIDKGVELVIDNGFDMNWLHGMMKQPSGN